MNGRKLLLLLVLSCLCLTANFASAQALLSPPFGLNWGDSPDKILDWAADKKLNVTIDIKGKTPSLRILKVTSERGFLPGQKAAMIETRYHWGKLYEVTLRYGNRGAKPAVLIKNFEKLKRGLEDKHGKMIPNQAQKVRKGNLMYSTQSYHVEPVAGLMLVLAFSEVEDLEKKRKSARFSVVYRNQNILSDK